MIAPLSITNPKQVLLYLNLKLVMKCMALFPQVILFSKDNTNRYADIGFKTGLGALSKYTILTEQNSVPKPSSIILLLQMNCFDFIHILVGKRQQEYLYVR